MELKYSVEVLLIILINSVSVSELISKLAVRKMHRSSLGNAAHMAPWRSIKGPIACGIHCATLWKVCTASKDLNSMSVQVELSVSNWKVVQLTYYQFHLCLASF